MESPFDVLRVDPSADESEIERAYRRRVIETHPDQGGSSRELQRVREAYEAIRTGDWEEIEGDRAERNGEWQRRDDGAGSTDREDGQETVDVEFLDYQALDDHGWTLDDDDLFEKAADAGLDPDDYGRLSVDGGEPLLDTAERCGFRWPYACRGGACANCAVAVVDGALEMSVDHVLTEEMVDRGISLSCIGTPTTEELRVVYNVKHLPDLDDLRLPAYRFEQARVDE